MKKVVFGILLLSSFMFAGCSSEPKAAEEKLAKVKELLVRGYDMTPEQREKIDKQMKQVNEFMAAGKTEEASKVLSVTIEDLEKIGEYDRFNKSE